MILLVYVVVINSIELILMLIIHRLSMMTPLNLGSILLKIDERQIFLFSLQLYIDRFQRFYLLFSHIDLYFILCYVFY
jgi:hypothetical protein